METEFQMMGSGIREICFLTLKISKTTHNKVNLVIIDLISLHFGLVSKFSNKKNSKFFKKKCNFLVA